MTSKAEDPDKATAADNILISELQIVNVGLESFAMELKADGVPVQHCDWRPPGGGDKKLAALLAVMGA